VELTEAYSTLRNAEKRKTYDNLEFGELPSHDAHRQFVNKFEDEEDFHRDEKNKDLSGFVKKVSQKDKTQKRKEHSRHNYDQYWPSGNYNSHTGQWEFDNSGHYGEHNRHPDHKGHHHLDNVAEEYTRETTSTKGPEGQTSKTVTHRSSIVNGKHVDVRVEEVTKPDGSTEVVETINDGGHVRTNKFSVKDGHRQPAIENRTDHTDRTDNKQTTVKPTAEKTTNQV